MRTDVGLAIIVLSSLACFDLVSLVTRTAEPPSPAAAPVVAVSKPYYTIAPNPLMYRVVKTEAAPAPAEPAGPYSTESSIATLLANPATRAVMLQNVPALSNVSGDQIAMVSALSVRMVQSMLPGMLSNDVLRKLDQDLAKIPASAAASSSPAPAPAPAPAPQVVAAANTPPADPAAPAQAAALSSRSTLSSLLGNPAAREVLMREIPALAQAPQAQLNLAAGMSLRDIQRLMPQAVSDAALQRVDQGLDALKPPAATPAPAA